MAMEVAKVARGEVEYKVCPCPKSIFREAKFVFPFMQKNEALAEASLLVIPTCQKALHDLVKVGPEIEEEKDRLLEVFMEFAKAVCTELRDGGHWADYIDPCSGLPMMTEDCNKVYSEVDGMEAILQYKTMNCGCCKVLLHPKWGSGVYPATMFTSAPSALVKEVFNRYSFSTRPYCTTVLSRPTETTVPWSHFSADDASNKSFHRTELNTPNKPCYQPSICEA
jgi:hypothetical protein